MIIDSLGESSIVLTLMVWINQGQSDFAKVRGEAIRQVKLAFDQHGIEMPNPIINIEMRSSAYKSDGPLGKLTESKSSHAGLKSVEVQIDKEDSSLNLQPDKTIERQLRAQHHAQIDDNLFDSDAKHEL